VSDRSSLEEINIRGIGVIEEASLQLSSGLTVFTGETGAGKTMILTALSLVLGEKVDASLVRQGKDRLTASATFRVNSEIERRAIERGAAIEDRTLILTRTLGNDGRSKATAGGVNVPSGVLSDLGESLVEIHGQAASMSLSKVSKQRELIDNFGGPEIDSALENYKRSLNNFLELKKKILSLRKSASGREKELAALEEFSQSFLKVKPQNQEFASLSSEISRLSSVEALRFAMNQTAEILDGEDSGILTSLSTAKRALESVADKDPLIGSILDNVAESYFLLAEVTTNAHRYLSDLDADPERLELAQVRRAELTTFVKRFAESIEPDDQIEELIKRFDQVALKIEDLTGGDERISVLEKELEGALQELKSSARGLSVLRAKYAERLSDLVSQEIHSLSMPHTQFICSIQSPDYSAALTEATFTIHGCDEIAMNIRTHAQGPLVSVAKGASGGELSRIMLALEVVIARSAPVGTYIFDEIDAGVGGKAAIEVGRRLHSLSRHAQVIVVTHLPQVAAWADSHFVLTKNQDGFVNQSSVTKVTGEDRVEEIARMLAGHESSKSAREHAAELLEMNEERK